MQATVNRSKGNRTELSRSELIQKSSYCRVSGILKKTPQNYLELIYENEMIPADILSEHHLIGLDELQVGTWISSSCQPMATFANHHKIRADAESNSQV